MSNQKISSSTIGFGLATFSFIIFALTALFLWSDLSTGFTNGFGNLGSTLVTEAIICMVSFGVCMLGIKMATPVSNRFLGMIYVPMGLIFTIAAVWWVFVGQYKDGAHPIGPPGYQVLPILLGLSLLGNGIAKLFGGASATQNKLDAPTDGTFLSALWDFIKVFVIALVITVGSATALIFLVSRLVH
jgi:hypothetical protein